MIVILNIDNQKFSLNGIPYFKNFMPHVLAGKLKIVSVYDSKFELTPLDNYSNYLVNGIVYTSVLTLQEALLPITYMRNSLSSDNSLKLDKGTYTGTAQDLDEKIQELSSKQTFKYSQPIPSSVWLINHKLQKYPSVTVLDGSGYEIEGEVEHINENNLTISFSVALSGYANLN